MADYVMIEDIFESVDNMQIIRNNSQNDDGTDTVVGVDWFKFRETTANTFFVSGNTWIGMGQNAEQLRISRRDADVFTIRREEGTLLANYKFFRIRWEGYNVHGNFNSSTKLVWDAVFFDTGDIVLNIVEAPSNPSNLGECVLYTKSKNISFSIAKGKVVTFLHKDDVGNDYELSDGFRRDVKTKMGGIKGPSNGTQASVFAGISEADTIPIIGKLCQADMKSSGVLASVSAAQFILESGYGKSELAQNANNCFGMKKSLSGNTWSGSAWDGKSIYTKKTQEQNKDGSYVTITVDFRKYPSVEKSVADHSAYLLGAKNGENLRYAGLKGCTDYKKAAQLIKDGGYATSLTYVEKLCSIIEKWNLTQFDGNAADTPAKNPDTVTTFPAVPFLVKVIIDDLNYRSEPSMNGKVNGQTGKGTFTIVEVRDGWGRLKSGAGWIWLCNPSYCTIGGVVAATTASKSVDELAREVIQGKWSNGEERKQKLKAAGYDYSAVQSRVNELLK